MHMIKSYILGDYNGHYLVSVPSGSVFTAFYYDGTSFVVYFYIDLETMETEIWNLYVVPENTPTTGICLDSVIIGGKTVYHLFSGGKVR